MDNSQQDKINIYKDFQKEIFVETNKDIKLNLYEIYSCCLKNKVKKEKLKLTKGFINHYLNINAIVKVINEFEGLKKLILDPDQRCLFEFYNRTYQNLTQIQSVDELNEISNSNEIKIKILKSMKNLNAKNYKSHIDMCLIDYFFNHHYK